MNENSTLLSEIKDGKGIITINRPKVLNALNKDTYLLMKDAIENMVADERVRVIIFTGAGEKAFCAGGDIGDELALGHYESYEWSRLGHEIYSLIENCPKPTVAAINGYCLGGGFELALACDMRICAAHAKMGAPESKLGIICGFGGNIRLPRLIGRGKAKELLMTGKMLDAAEAYRLGLVNEVAPAGKLDDAVNELCSQLVNKSAIALTLIKHAVDYGTEIDTRSAIAFDSALFTVAASTEDKVEGMTAFLEKREPVFRDR